MVLPLHRRRRRRRQGTIFAWLRHPLTLRILVVSIISILSISWLYFTLTVFGYSNFLTSRPKFYFVRRHDNFSDFDAASNSRSDWAIFYHIFVPAKSHKNALRIVQEQLNQVSNAIADEEASHGKKKYPVALYYTTVGDLLPELREGHLPGCHDSRLLECRHWQHHDEGSESKTLQTIYNFCLQSDDPDQVVTYLHSKGSYHHHKVNERWRKHLTSAATHRDCILHTTSSNQQCNACGLNFYAQWTNFFPGNMWTARCDYIRKLLPPDTFAERQEEAIAKLLWLRYRGVLTCRLFSDRLDRYGLERYSTEHWIGSHPDIKPCDVAALPVRSWLTGAVDARNFSWDLAPRQNDAPADNPTVEILDLLKSDITASRKELFYLGGRLRLWMALYNTSPPSDSWIWAWFPDGAYWKKEAEEEDLLQLHDDKTLYKSLEEVFVSSVDMEPVDRKQRAQLMAFISINASEPSAGGAEPNIRRLLSLRDDGRDVRFLYQVLGAYWEKHLASIQGIASAEGFEALPHHDRFYEGDTVRHLHEYCQQSTSPDDLVMFVSTDSTTLVGDSKECVDAITKGKCNVCGDDLHTGGAMHFITNNWIAKCSYVRELLAPSDFVIAANQVTSRFWVEALKNRFIDVPNRDDCLGVDALSLNSWVTSHPEILPCRLPLSITMEPECYPSWLQSKVLERSDRLRSYFFLPGHLFRWYSMYGDVPSASSWIWSHFSDGEEWKQASTRYDAKDVVEMVTKPFADTSV